jgi:gamma-tubulin complex component 3
VLECSWDDLVKDLAAAQDLDQVIDAHRMFLKTLTERALLGSEPKAQKMLAQLRSIFDVIMKFRSVQVGCGWHVLGGRGSGANFVVWIRV